METKLENFKKELSELGLVEKSVRYILMHHAYLYHRIYKYAKKYSLWLPKVFHDLGLALHRVDGMDSIQKLDIFIKDIFHYDGGKWGDISHAHKNLIKKTIMELDIHFDAFLARYNIINPMMSIRIYQSVDEIKHDLISKGLHHASIADIRAFDAGKTIANIESFAKHNGFQMKDIWFALGVPYENGILAFTTGVKRDFVYHNDAEMLQDISSKGLIGKTKRDVWEYDNGKTAARVAKYAQRCGAYIGDVWKKLGIQSSERRIIEIEFSDLDELKVLVKERGLTGKTIREMMNMEPKLYNQVKKWARSRESMKYVWEYIGIVREQGFASIDEIVEQIHKAGHKTAKDMRADWNFYKRIAGFVKTNGINIKEIWERAGIVCSNEGRPYKKSV